MYRCFTLLVFGLFVSPVVAQVAADDYVKKENRVATVVATHTLHHLHTLSGNWYYAGPFDNNDRKGFETAYPPESGVDLKAAFVGKNGEKIVWKRFDQFAVGKLQDLAKLTSAKSDAVIYLYHEFDSDKAYTLPLSLGSDDSLSVWCNGKQVLSVDEERPAKEGQNLVDWPIKPGRNTLLLKVTQYSGGWEVYAAPEPSLALPPAVLKRIDRDFPNDTVAVNAKVATNGEAKYYRLVTVETPKECILEVGGLAFRPDGKLLIATRRGELWLLHNPLAEKDWKFTRYAAGLHEPLGIHVEDDHTFTVIQRPELTRIRDSKKDDVADSFQTLCDSWGVSGGYHEYAFGPAKDKDGNYFITLNVGFSGGGQSPVPWRGWCVKVTPDGKMEPWCYGIRSPNGVNFSPDGDLFYSDNQGEWVGTNKLCHLKQGKFYGHQASLHWVKDSPFKEAAGKVKSGMLYDGQAGPSGAKGMPEVEPPAIWFPYGRMGQSASEPVWDTTQGKFGPFAGQCFVGDQTRSSIMRVALEKVNGVYQGVAYPFRSGLQCGVNRLAFASDGSLLAGQTSRGWGSVGGKPYGLQRVVYTGDLPFEMHDMKITPLGFDLTFTKPVDVKTIKAEAFVLRSFTYIYHSTYGSAEQDTHGEKVEVLNVSPDGLHVSLAVPNRKPGRVYEWKCADVKSSGGDSLLHSEAYYTTNQIPK